ncbi:unnamed protein product, partial [Allacma fusca]
ATAKYTLRMKQSGDWLLYNRSRN